MLISVSLLLIFQMLIAEVTTDIARRDMTTATSTDFQEEMTGIDEIEQKDLGTAILDLAAMMTDVVPAMMTIGVEISVGNVVVDVKNRQKCHHVVAMMTVVLEEVGGDENVHAEEIATTRREGHPLQKAVYHFQRGNVKRPVGMYLPLDTNSTPQCRLNRLVCNSFFLCYS